MPQKPWHLLLALTMVSCGGADGTTPNARPSAAEPSTAPATSPSASVATSSSVTAAPPPSLDACILEVLRDPFPGRNIPADRFYSGAVEAFASGHGDAEKLFSEAYLYTGTGAFVNVALFGHAEIERKKREPIHLQFAIGKYDRILGAKTVEPLRELALMRKAQTLAALLEEEQALLVLGELNATGALGRCDASIRPAMAALIRQIVGGAASSTHEHARLR